LQRPYLRASLNGGSTLPMVTEIVVYTLRFARP